MKNDRPRIIQIGSYSPTSSCNAKVLDPDGICPTLLYHKGAEPAIIEKICDTENPTSSATHATTMGK